MFIGRRLQEIREERKLSQGDIEHRAGLVRPYISRVENGHTVPAVETLEKFARALEVPVYALFYDEEQPKLPSGKSSDYGRDARELEQLRDALARMPKHRPQLLMSLAQKMARGRHSRRKENRHEGRDHPQDGINPPQPCQIGITEHPENVAARRC